MWLLDVTSDEHRTVPHPPLVQKHGELLARPCRHCPVSRQFQRARNVTVTYYFGLKGLIQSVQSVLDYLAIVKPGTAILIIRVRGGQHKHEETSTILFGFPSLAMLMVVVRSNTVQHYSDDNNNIELR